MRKLVHINDMPAVFHGPTPEFLVLVAIVATTLAGCSRDSAQKREEWNDVVRAAVHDKIGNANRVYVDFRSMFPFDWDRVFFFPPYTTNEEIHDALGFRWRGAAESSISERDHITLVVFLEGKRVTLHIEHPRVEGDFSRLEAGYGYTTDQAYFEVIEEGFQDPWLVVQDAKR